MHMTAFEAQYACITCIHLVDVVSPIPKDDPQHAHGTHSELPWRIRLVLDQCGAAYMISEIISPAQSEPQMPKIDII